MDSAHDMGGAKGFGPVVSEPNEPRVSRRLGAPRLCADGRDVAPGRLEHRHVAASRARTGRRGLPRARVISRIWLAGLETLMIERRLVDAQEIEAGKVLSPPKAGVIPIAPTKVTPAIRRGGPTEREPKAPAMFAAGETVADEGHPPGDAYAAAAICPRHLGTIELNHGCHVFPDTNSLGQGEDPQWLYTVRFDGPELWGTGCRPDAQRLRRRLGIPIWSAM